MHVGTVDFTIDQGRLTKCPLIDQIARDWIPVIIFRIWGILWINEILSGGHKHGTGITMETIRLFVIKHCVPSQFGRSKICLMSDIFVKPEPGCDNSLYKLCYGFEILFILTSSDPNVALNIGLYIGIELIIVTVLLIEPAISSSLTMVIQTMDSRDL